MYSCCSERRMWVWSLCLIVCSLSYTLRVIASSSSSWVSHLCLPGQKNALWEFKNEFHVQGASLVTKTERWKNNTDCCSWAGVSCDPKTGKVVELDLGGSSLNGPLKSNSSLFRLQHLQSLNLGDNNISGILPKSIGNFKYLNVLDFGGCKFFGKIPSSLGNLSHLTDLNLSDNDFSGELPDSMGNFKYLKVLYLGGCKFFGNIPSSLGNLSHLTDLDLSSKDFTGELPDSLGNLNRLTKLRLVSTKLTGNFPPLLLNLIELTDISLSSSQFEGKLPSNMSSLSKLESFDIGGNSFSGYVPLSLFMIPSLRFLDLHGNDFVGSLEIGNFSSSSKLEFLYLGGNNFNGPIPRFISKLVGLWELDLSFWNTEKGMVDFSIFLHLKSLTSLYLAYINTRSMVDLSLFSHLESLEELNLSGINLKISSNLHLSSSIRYLVLSSCNISEFPKFLQTNASLIYYFVISSNKIEGQVPEWLWSLPELAYLNISHNFFTGFEGSADVIQNSFKEMLDISSNAFQDPFPLLPNMMLFFVGSDNQFSGEIPRTLCELISLQTLVLSNNNFSGSIPRCFQNLNNSLVILDLRNNSLSGVFPEESITNKLISIDVGLNRLSGKLPKSLISCIDLEFLNVEDNKINDEFPLWLGLLPNLQILVLRSNEFHGPISSLRDSLSFPKLRIFDISRNSFTGVLTSDYFSGWSAMSSVIDIVDYTLISLSRTGLEYYHKSLSLVNKGSKMELIGSSFKTYKTIDISGNRFEGNISKSIGLLRGLIVLNMSNNAFTGHIPQSLANLTNLESLDLSQNVLSGKIPPELGKLTSLSWMNFSYNRLEGPIPQSTQFQSQDSSSFAENPGLCGVPLQETCGGGEAKTQHQDAEKEESDQVISWIAAAIGYVPGIVCGFTIGHILNSYKRDWFMRIFHPRT